MASKLQENEKKYRLKWFGLLCLSFILTDVALGVLFLGNNESAFFVFSILLLVIACLVTVRIRDNVTKKFRKMS